MHVDPSNAEAAAAWDGPSGVFWADHADAFDAGVAGYMEPFLAAAAIAPDAHVLDVGCGIGLTTREAARLATAGSVTGIDLSARMLDLARRRAEREGLVNVRFEQAIPGYRPGPPEMQAAESSFDISVRAVQACIDAGVFAPGDAYEISKILWAAIHGVVSLEIAGHFPPDKAAQRYERLMRAVANDFRRKDIAP